MTVLWLDDQMLLLESIQRDAAGYITKANVVNGQYTLFFHPDTWEADYGRVVTVRVRVYQELAVPAELAGAGYNVILAWAKEMGR